jgi:sugar O-acyltransferase (sialic acid O-acetyltransferase NeuD family)
VTPLVLFGAGELARLAHRAFSRDPRHEVVACTVTGEHLAGATLNGLPVVAWERLDSSHPPGEYSLFVAVGYRGVNRYRRELCEQARGRGYTLASYVSPHALVAEDVAVKENTFVFEGAIVQAYAQLGRNVIVWSGALVSHDSTIGDNCFIAPRAAIAGNVRVGENCFIGVNATIRDGVSVAPDCVIGAGAIVKHDTRPGEVYSVAPTPVSRRKSSELERL